MKFINILLIASSLFLSACGSPRIQKETVYVDKFITVVPDLPYSMTEPVKPIPNPAKDKQMTQADILKWWTGIRYNLQEANGKLLQIRVWFDNQKAMINNQKSN